MESLDVTEIVWVDSNVIAGWNSKEWYEKMFSSGLPLCRSVGYKFYEDEQQVALAQNVSSTGGIGDVVQIPRVAITEMRVVRHNEQTSEEDAPGNVNYAC